MLPSDFETFVTGYRAKIFDARAEFLRAMVDKTMPQADADRGLYVVHQLEKMLNQNPQKVYELIVARANAQQSSKQ